jgi:formamidopyrimidine-DNA glycosylase
MFPASLEEKAQCTFQPVMPELPEVETIARGIKPHIEGLKISRVDFRLPRLVEGEPTDLAGYLKGRSIQVVRRRGKYLVFELDHGAFIVHLGMTGQLTYSPPAFSEDPAFRRTVTGMQKAVGVHPVDKHTHLVLHFAGGARLLFRDPRTFGKLIPVPSGQWDENPRIARLGPEPIEGSLASLAKAYPENSTRAIKAVLLDQGFIAGVGNIYADEGLFAAGIHPATPADSLTSDQVTCLLREVRAALKRGIKNQGTTFSDYRKPDGGLGSNQERLLAYGRGGEPCRRCGILLKKTVIAQRGTVFCPACQKPPAKPHLARRT